MQGKYLKNIAKSSRWKIELLEQNERYIYNCQKCGKNFCNLSHFINHQVDAHKVDKKQIKFQCIECLKKFITSYTFRRHALSHIDDQENPPEFQMLVPYKPDIILIPRVPSTREEAQTAKEQVKYKFNKELLKIKNLEQIRERSRLLKRSRYDTDTNAHIQCLNSYDPIPWYLKMQYPEQNKTRKTQHRETGEDDGEGTADRTDTVTEPETIHNANEELLKELEISDSDDDEDTNDDEDSNDEGEVMWEDERDDLQDTIEEEEENAMAAFHEYIKNPKDFTVLSCYSI